MARPIAPVAALAVAAVGELGVAVLTDLAPLSLLLAFIAAIGAWATWREGRAGWQGIAAGVLGTGFGLLRIFFVPDVWTGVAVAVSLAGFAAALTTTVTLRRRAARPEP